MELLKDEMKKLIDKISAFLKKLSGKGFDVLRDNSVLAVQITHRLKTIIESKTTATVVDLIPGHLDNITVALLKRVLPVVTEKLAILTGALQNEKDADVVEVVIRKLQELHPELRDSFYLAFSAQLNRALADGKISLAEAASLAQMLYLEIKDARG